MANQIYGGFWIRVFAAIIDSILLLAVLTPILFVFFGDQINLENPNQMGGWGIVINYLLPAVVVIIFWVYKSATPGKMVFKLEIVDAKTGGKPSTGQLIGRYLGYYVSMIPLFLGIFWVGFDKRKQGFHDKLAGTVVVYSKLDDNELPDIEH